VFDLVSCTRPAFQTSLMVFPPVFGILSIFPKKKPLTFAQFVLWQAMKRFSFFSPKESKLKILPQAV